MATRSQKRVILNLLTLARHHMDEIGLPYVIIIEGSDAIQTNSTKPHALAIMRDSLELHDMITQKIAERKAEKAADIAGWPEDGETTV